MTDKDRIAELERERDYWRNVANALIDAERARVEREHAEAMQDALMRPLYAAIGMRRL